jgi:hypothetical protein
MERIFYYFVKSALNGDVKENPICSDEFLGDIGDFIEFNGVGYIIIDYAEEVVDLEGDGLYW